MCVGRWLNNRGLWGMSLFVFPQPKKQQGEKCCGWGKKRRCSSCVSKVKEQLVDRDGDPPPPSTKQSLEMLNNISTLTLTLNPNRIYRRESLESSLSSLFFFTKSLISHFWELTRMQLLCSAAKKGDMSSAPDAVIINRLLANLFANFTCSAFVEEAFLEWLHYPKV